MSYDWSDPANWPLILSKKLQYEIVKLGPTRVKNYDFPTTSNENGQKRKFSITYYHRKLLNGDMIDRK